MEITCDGCLWGSKAVWGMSEQAIADAFQGKDLRRIAESSGDPVKRNSPLSLPKINIEGLPFKVYFFFGDLNGLESVLIKMRRHDAGNNCKECK
jgi:hypothetical protein